MKFSCSPSSLESTFSCPRRALDLGLSKYGMLACRRPWVGLLTGLIFVLMCMPGFLFFQVDTDTAIHIPRKQHSSRAYAQMRELFPSEASTVLFFVAETGQNLLAPSPLRAVGRAIDSLLRDTRTDAGEGFEAACDRSAQGTCEITSVFSLYLDAMQTYGQAAQPHAAWNKTEAAAVAMSELLAGPSSETAYQILSKIEGLLVAGLRRNAAGTLEAQSLLVVLHLDPNRFDATGKKSKDEFSKVVLNMVHGADLDSPRDDLRSEYFHVINFSEYDLELEQTRPGTKEAHLMGMAFALILAFLCCSIAAPKKGSRRRHRLLLGLSSMLVIGLSLLCGVALIGYLGVPYTAGTTLVIFTLFGVAVDDIIVLVHTYDRFSVDRSDYSDYAHYSFSEQQVKPLAEFLREECLRVCSAGTGLTPVEWLGSLLVVDSSSTAVAPPWGGLQESQFPLTVMRREKAVAFEDSMSSCLVASGSAITLTSATSFVGFLVASSVDLPSMTYFCITGAMCILSKFVLQLTVFFPLFIISEKRCLAGIPALALDPASSSGVSARCSGALDQAPPTRSSSFSSVGSLAVQSLRAAVKLPSVGGGCGLMRGFARWISGSWLAQAMIALFFLSSVGLASFGMTEARTDTDLTDYFVDGSFIKEAYDVRTVYSSRAPYYLMLDHVCEGFPSQQRQQQLESLLRDLLALDFVFGPEVNWLADFEAYLAHNFSHPSALAKEKAKLRADPAEFAKSVSAFLGSGSFLAPDNRLVQPWALKRHIVFKDGLVTHSRLMLQYESDFSSQARYIRNFKEQHELVSRTPKTVEYAQIMLSAERDDVIKSLIFQSLSFACLAVCAVVCLMLHPLVGLFVGALVVGIDVLVVAALTLYGLKLDLVAFLCLAMTVGLTVDYPCHTTHTYLHHDGSPGEKLFAAVSSMGSSIISGGGSTILGISVLALASSQAFRAFFWILGTAISLGVIVGVVVGPVLLMISHSCFLALRCPRGEKVAVTVEEKAAGGPVLLGSPKDNNPVLLGSFGSPSSKVGCAEVAVSV
eukprot:TRINITY_DN17257_c0_g1_i1.p1 TRINITY_DN17257_c0_g1~~TRINITY_DN17257_c0_g1_i1.p1  ORF type:complete len:1034 (+),score=160.62 TRINITY_DN17257_c0_g1_i1:108-3209(+)